MFINEKFSLRDVDKAYYYISILIPLIKEFNEESTNNSIYIAAVSYLYSILITTKIKNPILYKQIVDREYEVDNIINKINIPNLDHYKGNIIGRWHQKPLQEVIEPGKKFNLKYLSESKELNIINKLEFIDSFQIN